MHTSSLTIRKFQFARAQFDNDSVPGILSLTDFVVDGQPLANRLNVARASLEFASSSLDSIDPSERRRYAEELLARREPTNQLGSGRVVIYRCHCGSDYCGVVSTRIIRDADLILWRDIGIEQEDGLDFEHAHIAQLVFSSAEYDTEISRFFGLG